METTKVKEIVYSLLALLNNEQLPRDEKIFKGIQNVFGPFDENESQEVLWKKLHSLVSEMIWYKDYEYAMKRNLKYRFFADRFCKFEECPIRKIKANCDDNDFLNYVIGPQGHLKEGDANDFIKVILDRLSITGTITDAYYFDPYIKDTEKEPFSGSFTEKFLSELTTEIPQLVAVTTKTITINNSNVAIKKIPDGQIHDRFIIVLEEDIWKGVTVGGSLNGFPTPANTKTTPKKHFLITKIEDGDSKLLSEILKNNLS